MSESLKNNIFSISLGTTLSKLLGFLRQIFIAAAFGVGLTYDAYNYAYIIPGFLIIIIGGINGPLHNSIVTVLTPLKIKKARQILQNIIFKILLFSIIIGTLIFLNAEVIIKIIGPNLDNETQFLAARQLKILSLCIPLSGFNGLSYGALNSRNRFFISSLSPAIVSIVTIIFITFYWLFNSESNIDNNIFYSELLALATLAGTFIQTLIQIFETYKIGLFKFKFNFRHRFSEENRIIKLILPSSLSSGLGQINVFVDMFFASSFKGAASGLAYGNFLIQAPLGILSNSLILPILPKLSELKGQKNFEEYYLILLKSIEYCLLGTFLMMGIFIALNNQIVDLFYQRGAFNSEAANLVKKILIAYSLGLPAYLFRDLLIRIYYSIEVTKLPFKLSLFGIGLNIFFDWILVGAPTKNIENLLPFNYGVVGLVLSSGIVNLIVSIILSIGLSKHIKSLPHIILIKKTILITLATLLSISFSFCIINLYNPINPINQIINLFIGSFTYFFIYFVSTRFFKVNKFTLSDKVNLNKIFQNIL